jgi:hypothetical protein
MSTWQDIYGGRTDGNPVRAHPEPFSGESAVASTTAKDIDYVNAQFRTIRAGNSDGFEGATASAIANKAVDWQAKLEPAAVVFRDVARVLAEHADHLTTLQSDASLAVAQALAAWRLKNAAESRLVGSNKDLTNAQGSVNAADHNVAWIKTQIAAISPGSPDAQFRLPKLLDEERNWQTERSHRITIRNNTQSQVDAAGRDLATADRELDYWFNGDPNRSWQRLRHREDDLNNVTAKRIHDIGLRGVANPGWIDQHVSDFVDFLRHAVDTIKKAIETAVKAFIEAVKILLITIVVIVAVIVAIVALVVLIFSAVITVVIEVGIALLRLLPVILEVVSNLHRIADTGAHAVYLWNHYVLRHHPPNPNPDQHSYPGQMINQITAAHGDPDKLMNQYHRHLLELASIASQKPGQKPGQLPSGFRPMTAAEFSADHIDPALLDNPASGFHAAIFVGPHGEIIVAFANTDPMSRDVLTDWSDTEIGGWAIPGSQEGQAMALARQVYASNLGNVVFTGHSLGGDLATIASYATGGSPAVTFNAKGTNLDNLMTMDSAWSPSEIKSYAQKHIVAYQTSNDSLTYLQERSPVASQLPDALGNPVVLDRGAVTPSDILRGHEFDNLRRAMDQYPVLNAGAPKTQPAEALL